MILIAILCIRNAIERCGLVTVTVTVTVTASASASALMTWSGTDVAFDVNDLFNSNIFSLVPEV
jgi:hypothetical protein